MFTTSNCLGATSTLDGRLRRTCLKNALQNAPLIAYGGAVTDAIPDGSERSIFTYAEISEARGFTIRPPSTLVQDFKRSAELLGKTPGIRSGALHADMASMLMHTAYLWIPALGTV